MKLITSLSAVVLLASQLSLASTPATVCQMQLRSAAVSEALANHDLTAGATVKHIQFGDNWALYTVATDRGTDLVLLRYTVSLDSCNITTVETVTP